MKTFILAKKQKNVSWVEYIFRNVHKMPRTGGNKLLDVIPNFICKSINISM